MKNEVKSRRKRDRDVDTTPVLKIDWGVLGSVITTIGSLPAESGGPIGGNGDGAVVTQFHFDESSRTSAVTYSPDYRLLNRLFKTEWNPQGIRFRGFIHSHPGRLGRPSAGDEVYAERILTAIEDLGCLWLPIVNTVPDTGEFRLTPYAAYPDGRGVEVVRAKVQVVGVPRHVVLDGFDVADLDELRSGGLLDEISIGRTCDRDQVAYAEARRRVHQPLPADKEPRTLPDSRPTTPINIGSTFERVRNAYDLDRMHASRIFAAGAGGAADWLEQLARAGVEQFVLTDRDTVSETNLATQQTYRRDIGRPKVDCIAERIRDINPRAKVISLQKWLDDLNDDDIAHLALDPIDGRAAEQTIVCGLTDDFFAQARVNRLALKLGLPSLCAQVYREGRGAEVTFTYPGITPACHRCILSSRYKFFLEDRQGNDVTSHGTPIFATTRLNSIKGFVLLAMLHHGSDHPRWGGQLARIGKRNLIQIRMDPDLGVTVGLKIFDRVFENADRDRVFYDEVVWLPQVQECPSTGYAPCPDCGGTGDLRDAIGKFEDTSILPDDLATRAADNRQEGLATS